MHERMERNLTGDTDSREPGVGHAKLAERGRGEWGWRAARGARRGTHRARCASISYMVHDVSNMRGFDSYQLLTLSLAALMARISSVVIEGAHTSAGAATLVWVVLTSTDAR